MDTTIELIDLGDAMLETREFSPFGIFIDSVFNLGWYPW